MTAAEVIWHDVECGAYSADLPLWRALAAEASGPLLELGAGTGRVALALAAEGHDVTALDVDSGLLDELRRRAAKRDLRVRCLSHDACRLGLAAGSYALVLAPMQLLQVVGGPGARAELLAGVRAVLAPGGRFAAALASAEEATAPEDASPPLPDVAEHGGWLYSSLPLDVRADPGGIAVERLRQVVSPSGRLTDERHTELLNALAPAELEAEAHACGLVPESRFEIAATGDHVGSTVVAFRS